MAEQPSCACACRAHSGAKAARTREAAIILVSLAALAASYVTAGPARPADPAWAAVFLCGVPIVITAARGLVRDFDLTAGVLIAIALAAAVAVGEIFAAGEVAFLMRVGELLEERTVRRSRAGLDRLLRLAPKMARVLGDDGREEMIAADQVAVGMTLLVKPGETVPVDGAIVSGQTAVDQSALTGESVPVDLGPGDPVLAGGLNRFGAFVFTATRVGEDSSLTRLIRLVETADSRRAKVARLADRCANFIIPLALLTAVVTGLASGDLIRAVTILIVFCPCGLVLATPTAIVAAIGAAARLGVLVRSGAALERLGSITHMAFDKTGTLTRGEMAVESVRAVDGRPDALLALAAAAEKKSEHPLGQAVVRAAQDKALTIADSEDFTMAPGLGVRATVNGREVRAGRLKFMEGLEPDPALLAAEEELASAGQTVIWLAGGGVIKGLLGLSDTLRQESGPTIRTLKEAGLKVVLLTGDHPRAAARVARLLGIEDARAGLLPEDKVAAIADLVRRGGRVAMAGDGLNDAPALKTATVGVAVGGLGNDLTIEAADVALLSGSLAAMPGLIKLSRLTLRTIWVNIALALGINAVAIVLAALGLMGPVLGALVHNLGAVLVVLNATSVFRFKLDKNG